MMKLKMVICLFASLFFVSSEARIVLLNGTSSAGKSSIIKEFKKLMPNYTALSIDNFMLDLFNQEARDLKIIKSNESLEYIEEVRKYIDKQPLARKNKLHAHFNYLTDNIYELFHEHIVSYASKGDDVIIDNVLTHNNDIQDFFDKMEPYDVILVLAYCPFDTLPDRVNKRNNSGDKAEYRTLDSVMSQFSLIYKPSKKKGVGQIIHTVFDKTVELAKSFFGSHEHFHEFKTDLEQQLHIYEYGKKDVIQFKPRFAYDLIINTDESAPAHSAKTLKNFLNAHKKGDAFYRSMQKFYKKNLNNYSVEYLDVHADWASTVKAVPQFAKSETTSLVEQQQTILITLRNKYGKLFASAVIAYNDSVGKILGTYVYEPVYQLGMNEMILEEIVQYLELVSVTSIDIGPKDENLLDFFNKRRFKTSVAQAIAA